MFLEVDNVTKTFDDAEFPTINNISVNIEKGEFICVVGRSGCGKSTLLNMIAGLLEPSSGEIRLEGVPVKAPGADRVVMFQDHALFPWLNTIDNVKFGMKLNGKSEAECEETAMKYLSMVQLADYRDYPIHKLSGGMRQRVALARAFSMHSKVLLMDEPFSSLDKQTSNKLRSELAEMSKKTGQTIFFITHSVEEAVYLADRVVVMSSATDSVHEVINIELPRPRNVYDEEFVKYRQRILSYLQDENDGTKDGASGIGNDMQLTRRKENAKV